MKIEVYTDGSATIKTRPGGYGWVMVIDGSKHSEGNGHIPLATNNDAEMEAAIHGLAAALKFVNNQQHLWAQGTSIQVPVFDVTLVSDSQITLNWANGTYKFKQEAKYDRFAILKSLMERLNAKTRWVQGHSGDEHNERCDVLANEGRNGPKPPKPPKKPRKESRHFRWNEETNMYDSILSDKQRLVQFLDPDTSVDHNIGLETLTRIVIELIELEEARKK